LAKAGLRQDRPGNRDVAAATACTVIIDRIERRVSTQGAGAIRAEV
jgi:hypothetical protein